LLAAKDELEREDGGLKDKAVLKAESKVAADPHAPAQEKRSPRMKLRRKAGRKARRTDKETPESRAASS
jgi:hypothetical protein